MQFGKLLRERRKNLRLRQEDVAAGAGISYITYGDYERGKCFPKETTLRMLCHVLKLDYDDIYAAMVESKKLGDIAKAEQRARASEKIIGKEQWKQEIKNIHAEQRHQLGWAMPTLQLQLELHLL